MLGKPLLFLSSYAPLFGLLAIRFEQPSLWIPCVVLAGLGVGSLFLLLRLDARAEPGPHTLESARDAGPEAASYLAGYLLPFLTVAMPTSRDIIAYCCFIGVAACIYVRSPMIQVNPLLYVIGYRILSVRDSQDLNAYLITRRRVTTGSQIRATRFGNEVLIDRTSR